MLRREKGCRPFPRTPFSACGNLPPLRSRQVSLDEAEHFTAYRTIELPASLRFDGVRDHPGMPFGFPRERAFIFVGIPKSGVTPLLMLFFGIKGRYSLAVQEGSRMCPIFCSPALISVGT